MKSGAPPLQAPLLEVAQEGAPAALVLFGSFSGPENLAKSLPVDAKCDENRFVMFSIIICGHLLINFDWRLCFFCNYSLTFTFSDAKLAYWTLYSIPSI
jgi:hypothetical protein